MRPRARLNLTPNLLSPPKHISSDWVRVCTDPNWYYPSNETSPAVFACLPQSSRLAKKQTNKQQQQQKQNKTAKEKSGRLKFFICQIKACQVVFSGTSEQDFTKVFPLYDQT